MEIKEYQENIMRTVNKDLSEKEQIINMSLGLCGESGEVADIIKKSYFQGHELDRIKLINETGDICWYLFNLLNILGVDAREVFEYNIAKLQKRYKEGFSAADSVKRVDVKEECKHEFECFYDVIQKAIKYTCKNCGYKYSTLDTKVYNDKV